jgi:hypothetical protein
MKINFRNGLSLLALSLPLSIFAQVGPLDDGISTCGVPLCSLSEAMTALKAMNGDQRGMYAINLKAKYKDSKDLKVLNNLFESALEMKNLFNSLKDEDWVIRSANDLLNTSLLGLAKYSPINGSQFVSFYKELSDQTSRYAMISHWQSQVVNVDEVSDLEKLIEFADGAREHSLKINDEDWVSRAATAMITDITVKLTLLDPAHEGLYDVVMDQASLDAGVYPFNRIAVLESSSTQNLVVTFINTKHKRIVYSFSNSEIKGNSVSGKFLSNGDMAYSFEFSLDRKSGAIEGFVENTTSEIINFTGKQMFSSRTVFKGELPFAISEKDIVGTMNGELAGLAGKLSIKSFHANVYSATFVSNSGSVIIHFQGKFFSKKGVLSLTSNNQMKLTMSLRKNVNGVVEWSGVTVSTKTGTATDARFNKL